MVNEMATTSNDSRDTVFTMLYFSSAYSFTNKESEYLPAPLPISKLFDTLEEKYEGIKAKVLSTAMVTVNFEYVELKNEAGAENELVIKEGDEVAIIPPVSSG